MDFDTRAACYAWIERGDQVLLTFFETSGATGRHASGWTLPGGGVELDETLEECVVREVAEETGYAVRLTGLLGVRNHWIPPERRMHDPSRPLHAVQLVWSAEVTSGELVVEVEGTTTDARWVDLAQLRAGALEVVPLVADAARWAAAGPTVARAGGVGQERRDSGLRG